ncbi:MAG: ferrous iron transport protein A [Oscillospiraceae bacterium]|jgi:ferrous iron transport protein A|nr:ferrous iron transport protein A [Oscillospiraceae bacterium]
MSLNTALTGEKRIIRQVGGLYETRSFLGNLGFVEGSDVTVITELGGNLIVNVKGSRVALSKEIASHIIIS